MPMPVLPRCVVSVALSLATAPGSAITDSPLVDRRWVSAARLGHVYRF